MSNRIKFISLYYHTLRYLTFRQIYYQIVYRIKKSFSKQTPELLIDPPEVQSLTLIASIPARKSYLGNGVFFFLNKQKKFESEIDWNFSEFGKLWVYNLNYFDFLLQEGMIRNDMIKLIDSFCKEPQHRKEGNEPYPISLRGINWIKFFTYSKINNSKYNSILYSHYHHLAKNLEYHLMGNHLLENAFSLLYGSYYFRHYYFYKKAKQILTYELEEQILNDGAHFELSPMYHQIILFRLLDCLNLIKNNFWINDSLIQFLENRAEKMAGWLEKVTFSNGDIPMVNDSTFNIAPNSIELLAYAARLGVVKKSIKLSDSGYRMFKMPSYELFVDVGKIGPDYIPGHAHSDTLNYILYVNEKPLLVDMGITTYDRSSRRIIERSTSSHNTVTINNRNQSEVWASFRVGRRAKVVNLVEGESSVTAAHNGYEGIGVMHQRSWKWKLNELLVCDVVRSESNIEAKAYLYFYPGEEPYIELNICYLSGVKICFSENVKILVIPYEYSLGFNKTLMGYSLQIDFQGELITRFEFL